MNRRVSAAIAACLLAACSGAKKETTPGFTPGPRLGPEPATPAELPGREWLEAIHARFHERWAETFLEQSRQYLPPTHPLNDARLEVTLRLTFDGKGEEKTIEVVHGSGQNDFDAAAREVAASVGQLPPPPEALRSDDGNVYVEWLFARDARQDAVAYARVDRRRWDADKAVPALARAGRVAEAAARVAEAATPAPQGDAVAPLLALGRQAAGAGLVAGMADDQDPAVRVDAARAAGVSGLQDLVPRLRRLAEGAPDLELQAAALRALGELGDADSVKLFAAAVSGVDAQRAAAGARALVAVGRGNTVWETLGPKVQAGGQARAQALAILAEVGAPPAAVPVLAAALADKRAARGERADAARALGPAAAEAAGPAARALVAALAEPDATVRAAAADGLAVAGERGARSQKLYAAVAELFKDRDPRVRAAAIVAGARLWAKDALAEVTAQASRAKDPVILAACARALAELPAVEALAPLTRLAASANPDVRFAALRGLLRRRETGARAVLAKLASDGDPRVRELATAALDPGAAEAALADPVAEVRAAALTALVQRAGKGASLAPAMRALATAATAKERVLLARAYLEGTRAEQP